MDREQELEWLEAQKIVISEDLVAAAMQLLEFLAAVDRKRFLYDGPLLERAIHRYKTCWLPLLASYTGSGNPNGSLLAPLDCEWIWHCHRLNPVQYKKDCEELYGRVLGNKNVQSTLDVKSELHTVDMWAKVYPDEPFELDSSSSAETKFIKYTETLSAITYDLVSAVKRQSSFFYQVCRPIMHDRRFLDEAVARYKGFLHLIKRNKEKSMECFCVPTYDIDLIWHSHQLQPISYQRDMLELLGKVLEHDDTDSDRTRGKKLDTGFSQTTKQWEDTYDLRYWRAGSMFRGTVPALLEATPLSSIYNQMNVLDFHRSEKSLPLERTMVVEVLLEIVGIKNLPPNQKGNVFVSFSKKTKDMFLSGSCHPTIFSETGEKKVAGFECEPYGDLVLTLMTNSKPAETLGRLSISLEEWMDPSAKLSLIKWFELKPCNRNMISEPIHLHVAVSFTSPVQAPHVFQMLKLHPFSMNACKFPLPKMAQHMRNWSHVIDGYGSDIISLQMRKFRKGGGKKHPVWKHDIFGVSRLSKKSYLLAEECVENTWVFKDSDLSLSVQRKAGQRAHLVELKGFGQLKLFSGRRLEYQLRYAKQANDADEFIITAVEFSAQNPYGKAMALLDMKSALVKVGEDWFALPALLIAFILSHLLRKGERISPASTMENLKNSPSLNDQEIRSHCSFAAADNVNLARGGGCGGCGAGCGGDCGNITKSGSCGGCGSGCGGGCGSTGLKTGGCGGGCGNIGTIGGGGGGGGGGGCWNGLACGGVQR